MKKKVLLLDIDYTVINTDSMIDFLLYSLKTKPLKTIIKIPNIIISLALHAIKITSLNKAKEAVFSPIVDYTEEELEEFFKTKLEPKINKSIKNIIEKEKLENTFIIMITASPEAYMKYFKKYKYANEVIGTNLEYTNGKYKNKIIGKNCKGKEKIIRINKLLKKLDIEIDYENSQAYSDSKTDLPMLSLVKTGYLVNKKDGQIKAQITGGKNWDIYT